MQPTANVDDTNRRWHHQNADDLGEFAYVLLDVRSQQRHQCLIRGWKAAVRVYLEAAAQVKDIDRINGDKFYDKLSTGPPTTMEDFGNEKATTRMKAMLILPAGIRAA